MNEYPIVHQVEVVTAPLYEPVSLAEAKRWLRIEPDDTYHDDVVRLLISAMRRYAENLTFRAFVPRTLRLNFNAWPCMPVGSSYGNFIPLPFPPLMSVESFTYLDTDGTRHDMDTSLFEVFTSTIPGFIVPAYSAIWPSVRYRPNAIQVTYRAGYAPGSPADEAGYQEMIPENLRVWMSARIATLFENREQVVIGTIVTELQHQFADGLLDDLIIGQRLF